jgi:hypothetical protein
MDGGRGFEDRPPALCGMRDSITYRNQCRALSAQPIVGENSMGMRLAWRSFHAAIRRPASSSTCATPRGRFLLGSPPASVLHLAAAEAHAGSPNGKRRTMRIFATVESRQPDKALPSSAVRKAAGAVSWGVLCWWRGRTWRSGWRLLVLPT